MALGKRVTKQDIRRSVNDEAELDRLVEKFLKQDGYRLSEGSLPLTHRSIFVNQRCHLCNHRWTQIQKVEANVTIDPDVVLYHDTCKFCHLDLLKKSKCELALLAIALASKGQYIKRPVVGDSTDQNFYVQDVELSE